MNPPLPTVVVTAAGVVALLAASSCGTAVLDPVGGSSQEAGLVAHFPLDEMSGTVIHDRSPNQVNGMVTSGVGTWTSGQFGGALFLRRGEQVQIPNFMQATADWTVSIWLRFAPGDLSTQRSAALGNNIAEDGGWEINAPNSANPPQLEFSFPRSLPGPGTGGGGNNPGFYRAACCFPAVDTWIHVTGRVNGATKRVRIDSGGDNAETAVMSLIRPGTKTLFIGTTNPSGFQGTIDDIRIYNRYLTDPEVVALDKMP